MIDIEIRDVLIDDHKDLQKLYTYVDNIHSKAAPDFFKSPRDIARTSRYLEKLINDEKTKFLVACKKNEIIGFIHSEIRQIDSLVLKSFKYGHIKNLVVRENYTRCGIGSMLLKITEDWLKKLNVTEIDLTVFNFNISALSFYKKNGLVDNYHVMRKKID